MAVQQKELDQFLTTRSGYDTRPPLGQIDGVVQDASGEAKAGAVVKLIKTSNGIERMRYTNDKGVFSFDTERKDIYRVSVIDPSSGNIVSQDVELGDGEKKQIAIKLS
jgi:hypothetical protein